LQIPEDSQFCLFLFGYAYRKDMAPAGWDRLNATLKKTSNTVVVLVKVRCPGPSHVRPDRTLGVSMRIKDVGPQEENGRTSADRVLTCVPCILQTGVATQPADLVGAHRKLNGTLDVVDVAFDIDSDRSLSPDYHTEKMVGSF
jgi:hypothetical protein